MFNKRIYYLKSICTKIHGDVESNVIGVFSTKRKAKGYFNELIKSLRNEAGVVVDYNDVCKTHTVLNPQNANRIEWCIEIGDVLDKEWNGKSETRRSVFL